MFSFHPQPDPNLSHAGFYIILAGFVILAIMGIFTMSMRERKELWPLWVIITITLIFGYRISFSEWERPVNQEYTAKFIQFVPQQEKHVGIKGAVSYTQRTFCEYDINGQRLLLECGGNSPPFVKIYWNKR